MDEIWVVLKEDCRYKISNTGKLKRNDGFVPKCTFDKDGYLELHTIKGHFRVHRLVAKYFVKNNDAINNKDVHHKDHNKLNNNYLNLEWINRGEHSKDTITNKHRLETLRVKKIIKYNSNGSINCIYNSKNELYKQENALVLNFIRDKTYNRCYNNYYYFEEGEEFNPHRKGFIRGKVYAIYNSDNELMYIGNINCIAEKYNKTPYEIKNIIKNHKCIDDVFKIKLIYNDKNKHSYNTSKDKININFSIGRKGKDIMHKKINLTCKLSFVV